MQLDKYIYAHALKNAIEYGKTTPDRVLPKLFQHGLEKEKIKETTPEILKIVKEINSLSNGKRTELFKKYEKFVEDANIDEETRSKIRALNTPGKTKRDRVARKSPRMSEAVCSAVVV